MTIDKDAVREWIRSYILGILDDGDWLRDVGDLADLGVSDYFVQFVVFIGWMLSMIGGF